MSLSKRPFAYFVALYYMISALTQMLQPYIIEVTKTEVKQVEIEDNDDMKLFIEMCFDPNSPISAKLKDTVANDERRRC